MAKEDSQSEILTEEIRTLREQLGDEMKKDQKDMSRISDLQDLIDDKEAELEAFIAKDNNETTIEDESQEKTPDDNKDKEETITDMRDLGENKEEKEPEELDSEIIEEEKREEKEASGEKTQTLRDWQRESGIDIIPDESIIRKYDKYLTREEFMVVLNNENVPKVVKEAGRAEQFLKSPEDWDTIRTSKSALEQTLNSNDGKLPLENMNEHSYMLMIPDNKIEDRNGDGNISVDDFRRSSSENMSVEEQQIRETIPYEVQQRYEILRTEEIEAREEEARATMTVMANSVIADDQAAKVAETKVVEARMKADAKEVEKGKIEDEYDLDRDAPEEIDRKPPVV